MTSKWSTTKTKRLRRRALWRLVYDKQADRFVVTKRR